MDYIRRDRYSRPQRRVSRDCADLPLIGQANRVLRTKTKRIVSPCILHGTAPTSYLFTIIYRHILPTDIHKVSGGRSRGSDSPMAWPLCLCLSSFRLALTSSKYGLSAYSAGDERHITSPFHGLRVGFGAAVGRRSGQIEKGGKTVRRSQKTQNLYPSCKQHVSPRSCPNAHGGARTIAREK